MNTIVERLKERFVRDNKLSIRIYDEPYFYDRLKLYDPFFNTLALWDEFTLKVSDFHNDEAYFEAYNKVKDNAINYIKDTEAYQEFNKIDMNQYSLPKEVLQFSSKDIFHDSNIGRTFISIDMRKANFSSMKYYNPAIFNHKDTWEEFLSMFTDNAAIIKSKYIREVILGNCNPSRHITYEKYLTGTLLLNLMNTLNLTNKSNPAIIFFSNDEIILDFGKCSMNSVASSEIYKSINQIVTCSPLPFRIELFTLTGVRQSNKIETIGYIREMYDNTFDFKCFNNFTLPFVLRKMLNQPITESDLVFKYENNLAKFLETPEITIIKELKED